MKLSSISVTEFQSIRDSNPVTIGDITCLVGKNEAGKTALLQAIYRLNPIEEADSHFDVTDDFPRADVDDYQHDIATKKREPATVITARFSLESDEIVAVESEFGSGVISTPEFTLSKGYKNTQYYELHVNEKIAVKNVIQSSQLPGSAPQEFKGCSSFKQATDILADYKSEPQDLEKINQFKSLINKITQAGGIESYIYNNHLKKSIPKFLYFDEYYVMTGQENIESLKQRMVNHKLEPSDHPLLGLIELARLDLDQLVNPQRTQWLVNSLEGAGNHLSKKVLKYWSQNKHLQMRFDVRPARPGDPQGMTSGTNIWAQIYDSKRMVTTALGSRSRGFVWFFSFLAWFDQQQRKNEPLILLLDEPGLFLHGTAQGDLLRYIETELKGNVQVIYTTHSPFMVDPTHFERVRIVQDIGMDSDQPVASDEEGTKVITDVLEATADSLFPLQGALGYDIYQTLFVGSNNLVVEGTSDLLYIQTISSLLDSMHRKRLSEKWTITPVGGSDKVPTFVALLGAQKGLNIATLIDIQKHDRQRIENLYKKKLLNKKNVLTFGDFLGVNEADIEDMFGIDFYLQLVNVEYAKDLKTPIKSDMLTEKTPRVVAKLEKGFSSFAKSNIQFNHYRPARYFAESIASLASAIPPKTLDDFEAAFTALNSLL